MGDLMYTLKLTPLQFEELWQSGTVSVEHILAVTAASERAAEQLKSIGDNGYRSSSSGDKSGKRYQDPALEANNNDLLMQQLMLSKSAGDKA